jgi:hypothetical protein
MCYCVYWHGFRRRNCICFYVHKCIKISNMFFMFFLFFGLFLIHNYRHLLNFLRLVRLRQSFVLPWKFWALLLSYFGNAAYVFRLASFCLLNIFYGLKVFNKSLLTNILMFNKMYNFVSPFRHQMSVSVESQHGYHKQRTSSFDFSHTIRHSLIWKLRKRHIVLEMSSELSRRLVFCTCALCCHRLYVRHYK